MNIFSDFANPSTLKGLYSSYDFILYQNVLDTNTYLKDIKIPNDKRLMLSNGLRYNSTEGIIEMTENVEMATFSRVTPLALMKTLFELFGQTKIKPLLSATPVDKFFRGCLIAKRDSYNMFELYLVVIGSDGDVLQATIGDKCNRGLLLIMHNIANSQEFKDTLSDVAFEYIKLRGCEWVNEVEAKDVIGKMPPDEMLATANAIKSLCSISILGTI